MCRTNHRWDWSSCIQLFCSRKGLGTSINDKVIYVKLRNAIYDWNASVSEKISISVDNGSILITGQLKNIDTKIELTKVTGKLMALKK